MKQLSIYMVLALSAVLLIQACGPSEEELQQREQARLDSLERVRIMQLEQARADSLARVQRQEEEQRRLEEERRTITYTDRGTYTVQVGSWRSIETAATQRDHWKNRGFEHAYVSEFVGEHEGDVWFRVRLGRVADRNEAEKLQRLVKDDHNAPSWISQLR